MTRNEIHHQAVLCAREVNRYEIRLLDLIHQVAKDRIFEDYGCTSLWGYCVDVLKLSQDRAYNFSKVAQVSIQVPELKLAIEQEKISLSNGRTAAQVITPENKELWLNEASQCSSREWQSKARKANPKKVCRDRVIPVAEEISELRCPIDEEARALLKRVQDLVSQQSKKAASTCDAIKAMAKLFLEKKDPVVKAERILSKAKKSPVSLRRESFKDGKRTIKPQAIVHRVVRRSQGRCEHVNAQGLRCSSRRWLDMHHKLEVSRGGEHSVENLEVLCSAHHRFGHRGSFNFKGFE